MVKRKIWMVLLVLVMFFEISNASVVIATSLTECQNQCNAAIPIGGIAGISSTTFSCGNLCGQIASGCNSGHYSDGTLLNLCQLSYCPSTNSFGLADQSHQPILSLCQSICGQMKSRNVLKCPTTPTNSNVATVNPFDGCTNSQINTALGCIPTEVKSFVSWLLGYLFGIAGGIAFLLMVYGFILIATSGGDEKKMAGAKETITSAIVGLLVCIFSIFILRLIAVNILQIPGF